MLPPVTLPLSENVVVVVAVGDGDVAVPLLPPQAIAATRNTAAHNRFSMSAPSRKRTSSRQYNRTRHGHRGPKTLWVGVGVLLAAIVVITVILAKRPVDELGSVGAQGLPSTERSDNSVVVLKTLLTIPTHSVRPRQTVTWVCARAKSAHPSASVATLTRDERCARPHACCWLVVVLVFAPVRHRHD